MAKQANSAAQKGATLRQKVLHFWRDRRGNYAVITALMAPVLIGSAGLATEGGLWMYVHQNLQGAADSAALSSATLYGLSKTGNLDTQAQSVAKTYGYTVGTVGNLTTSVTVHRPPATGAYTGNNRAIEVIVTTQQARLLSSLYGTGNITLKGRAVALPGNFGVGCVLSLNASAAGGVTSKGNSAVDLSQCSVYDNSSNAAALVNGGTATINALSVNVVGSISGGSGITTTDGVNVGISPVDDPYGNVAMPSYGACDYNNKTYKTTVTINPGVYCNGIQLNAGAVVTMNPGIYFIDRGSLQVAGGATLQGTGVTIIFTSSTGSNYASATINGGAVIKLTAPTDGPTKGLVMFGDRNMPSGTSFKFNGGNEQILGGAVYLPKGTVEYAGGNTTESNCTQVIGDTVTFVGNSVLKVNCSGAGTTPIGVTPSTLVE